MLIAENQLQNKQKTTLSYSQENPRIYASTKTIELNQKQNPNQSDFFSFNTNCLLKYSIYLHSIKLLIRAKKIFNNKNITQNPDRNHKDIIQSNNPQSILPKVQQTHPPIVQSNNSISQSEKSERNIANFQLIKQFPNLQTEDKTLYIYSVLILFLRIRLNKNLFKQSMIQKNKCKKQNNKSQKQKNKSQKQKNKSQKQNNKQAQIYQFKLKAKLNFFKTNNHNDNIEQQIFINQQIQNQIFNHGQITWKDLFYAVFKVNQKQICLNITYAFIQVFAMRFTMHILVPYLFNSVYQQNISQSYTYAIIIGFLFCIHMYFYGLQKYSIIKVSSSFRYGLTLLMIKKIISLPQYTLKKAELGKMLNLISNDLNMIQQKFQYLGKLIPDPIYMIAVFILIIIRYDWAGCACIVFILLIFALTFYISVLNNNNLILINKQKDQRLEFTTQIIQGIKFIKTYGWEIAVKNIIQKIRSQQGYLYFILSIRKGIQTSLAFSAGNFFSLILIVVFYLVHSKEELTSAMIFSILQVFMFFRVETIVFSYAVTSLFQVIITLNRYSSILNIKGQRMIQIEKENNQIKTVQIKLKVKPFQYNHFSSSQKLKANISSFKKLNNSIINNQQDNDQNIKSSCVFIKGIQNFQSSIANQLTNLFLKDDQNNKNILFQVKIQYEDCSIGWNKDKFFIQDINWKVQKPTYIGVAGKIGSGKSTLLYSLLQEIPYYKGTLKINGKVAYVQQEPILFSMSIRDNILFQKPYNEQLYHKAINNSLLAFDIKGFPQKDRTIVGQKGLTLSGGQKSRLALARALYTEPDILILDDPFSAVDPHVGMQIFKNVILKEKNNKIIVLATHHIQYYEQSDYILFLENHKIVAQDTYQNLLQKLSTLNKDMTKDFGSTLKESKLKVEKRASINAQHLDTKSVNEQQNQEVTFKSYFKYFLSSKKNYVLAPLMIVLFVGSEVVNTFAYRFLANYDKHKFGVYYLFDQNYLTYWLAIAGLFVLYFILNALKFNLVYLCVLYSNEIIHELMIYRLLRAPMKYFDRTPSGQIISRFSNDLGILDYSIAFSFVGFFSGISITIVMSINIFQVNIIYVIPSLISAVLICILYAIVKKPLEKTHGLDLSEKSPLFTNMSQTITGMIQLKYYSNKQFVLKTFNRQIDNSSRINFSYWSISKLFDLYVYYIGALSFFAVLMIGLSNSTKQAAGQYAMAVVFMIQVNDYIGFFFKQLSVMQNNMLSYQRVQSIINLDSQAQFVTQYDRDKKYVSQFQDELTKQKTPQLQNLFDDCRIQIQNLSMKYASDLPLIINNLSMSIKGKEKIGIAGRTGAGKSSVVQFLLRLTEPEPDSLYTINDENALRLGLHTLRKNISVIPQKTFFFSGTLRKNLDPFDQYTDETIWQALQHSNLKPFVQKLEKGLQTNISLIENTFSVGQRQLLSLSRVLLRKNKILILDEATSSVDSLTDELIQKKIKENFSDATVFTIAHRLSTIADYDKIAVIDKGKIVQFDHPYNLLMKKGLFWDMVNNSGSDKQKIINIANKQLQIL